MKKFAVGLVVWASLTAMFMGAGVLLSQSVEAQTNPDDYLVHAIIRIPEVIPETGTSVPETGYTLYHVQEGPFTPSQAYPRKEWWLEYGVEYDRKTYKAVVVWIDKIER